MAVANWPVFAGDLGVTAFTAITFYKRLEKEVSEGMVGHKGCILALLAKHPAVVAVMAVD
jgi:hypothetical protein